METKTLFAAIVGCPNVGKSSLMNQMLGEKVAIVTHRPQTTRTRITGILTEDNTQLVFTDTPGLHRPKTKLSGYMLRQINESLKGGDATVLVVEPQGAIKEGELQLIETAKKGGGRLILAINKIDILKEKAKLLERISDFAKKAEFDEVIPLSAKTGEGVDTLLTVLRDYAAPSPFFFDEDSLTDQPERVIVGEIIREKLLMNLQDEVPHGTAVVVERQQMREGQSDLCDIEAVIVCERDTHKGIIIGKGGAMLKKISTQARLDIEKFLDCRVNLHTFVKVREEWRQNQREMRSLGFH